MVKLGKMGKKPKKGLGTKKKAKNVLEKKMKGMKLKTGERKKAKKMEERMHLKAEINANVKQELARFKSPKHEEEDDTRDSINSESSFGSQPKRIPKKRVSFAKEMLHTKVFDKSDYKSMGQEKSSKKKVKVDEADKENLKTKGKEGKAAEKKESKDEEEKVDADETEGKTIVAKKKKPIQVTKKVKEQLLSMPRKERKAFLRQLKAKKNPIADRALECKKLWERIRSSKTPKQEVDDSIGKLVGLVKGHAAKLVYAHDTSRVIECLVALKRPGINNLLFEELSSEIVRMTKSKYAKFFVMKMLKNGNRHQRETIMNAFRGHAVSLLRITHSAEVLETAYNDFANAQQRFDIISEFYGKEFVLFRTDKPRTLEEIVAEEPSKKKLITQHLEEIIQTVIEKTTIRLSLTHRLLLDFANHCDAEQLTNLIDSLKDKIPEIIHTQEGSRVACKCIWSSAAKDRKLIVKNFKDLSVKAAMEHYGHRVLMAIFDSVDDTVLTNKFITSELGNEIGKLIDDQWGERTIHSIFHPRDGRSMDKQELQILTEGDSNAHSKKNKSDRYAEVYKAICESLYLYVAANMEKLIFQQNKPKFVIGCLETTSQYDLFERKVSSEYRKACYEAIVELAKREFVPMDSECYHLIEHDAGHFVLQGLFRCDPNLPEEERLSVALAKGVPSSQLGGWISCNKGCHILLKMIQTGGASVKKIVLDSVNKKQLKEYAFKGAMLLAEALENVNAPMQSLAVKQVRSDAILREHCSANSDLFRKHPGAKKEDDEMLEKIDIENLPRAQKRFAKQFEKMNMERVAEIFKKNYMNIRTLAALLLLVVAIYTYTIVSVTQETFLEEIDEEVALEKPETHGHLMPAVPPKDNTWWGWAKSWFV
ncbi:hypothetical protein WR25_26719 [Diploscapter pachys]|uniref:PUM-HD domain-containing protein n=1 Tax=Diploscapter pachys TaxID=2018661 RepID=A0A2A2KB37_9BILA|nr:hypothetical protein WR25_26719 [Diploscapter pachys]